MVYNIMADSGKGTERDGSAISGGCEETKPWEECGESVPGQEHRKHHGHRAGMAMGYTGRRNKKAGVTEAEHRRGTMKVRAKRQPQAKFSIPQAQY